MALFATVFGLYALATVLIFWPWVAHLSASLIGPPEDNLQDLWNTWYAAAGHAPGRFFATNLLRFPEGTPLIYQSFAYPQVALVVLLSRIFGTGLHTLVALQNATLLLSFPLAGLGAFYLVRHFARGTAGGLIGGFVFAFNPSHVAHVMHHAHVSSIEFLPFFALAYLLALERRSYAWLAAAVAFFALSALSSWYYLFYCAYFVAFHLLYLRVRDHAWPRGWNLIAPALCLAATGLLLAPWLVPMIAAAQPGIYDTGANTYVADLAAYVAFPPEHVLAGFSRGLYARLTGYPWEATVYLGLVNLAILAWLCWQRGLRRTSPAFYVIFGMAMFALLASGEALHVGGTVTPLHLLDVALDKLPFFANVRTPSRAIVFVYLFLSIGIGLAVALALEHRQRIWRAGAAVAAVLIVLDFYPAHLAATPIACPPGVSVLERDGEQGFGVLNLPFGYVEDNVYMFEQICHGRPMVDGNTSREMANTLIYRLSMTDLNRQRGQLARAHVKYILLHHPRNGLFAWSPALPPPAQFLKTYRAVYDAPDMTVLRVY
ncbi:MAG: hypothetical protein WDM86_03895 [Rhizomicrobium sp.]